MEQVHNVLGQLEDDGRVIKVEVVVGVGVDVGAESARWCHGLRFFGDDRHHGPKNGHNDRLRDE